MKNPSSSEVSQISDKQPNGKGMSSDGAETLNETYSSNSQMAANTAASNSMSSNTSVSNAASMNSASNSAANFSPMSAAPSMLANSNAAILSDKAEKDSKTTNKPASPAKEPIDLVAEKENSPVAGAAPPPAPMATPEDNNFVLDGELAKQQNQAQQNTITQNQSADIITPDSRNVKRVPMPSSRAETKKRSAENSRDDADDKLKSAATTTATTSVGGKTFRRADNVWYDTAYRGQATKNVTRGTNEYKKLDAGLRGIAENLGGTVVIVWKQKAYRIQ